MASAARSWRQTLRWRTRARAPEHTALLGQRRVYILPGKAGLGFGGLLLMLLVASINYNLGLGYALTFLALSCALVDLLLTWRNLAYLTLAAGRAAPVFAGQEALFELQLSNPTPRPRYALWLAPADASGARHGLDLAAGAGARVTLALASSTRGWLAAPQLVLSTGFPLGLFRAWAYWRPALQVLVYPCPEVGAPPLPQTLDKRSDGVAQAGNDDFAGVRPYQPGDPLRALAWRQIARLDPQDGGQLMTKQFAGGAEAQLLFDLAALPRELDLERRLARLTRWVLDAEQAALPYALQLGAAAYASGSGAAHAARCLRALALYPQEAAP